MQLQRNLYNRILVNRGASSGRVCARRTLRIYAYDGATIIFRFD